jgi:fumarate reductase flavoprotein subunit
VRLLSKTYVGVDPVKEPIPIRPVVHYMMGGIDTDVEAATSLPGLYAAGEVACASLNGANRLGSNSLTECLVFGASAGKNALAYSKGSSDGNEQVLRGQADAEAGRIEALRGRSGSEKISTIRKELNTAMESGCGVYRQQDTMQACVESIEQLKVRAENLALEDGSKVFNTELIAALELWNMLDVAETVANSGLERKESRGAHTCRDFTSRDDANYLHHSMAWYQPSGRPRIDKKEVTLGHWEPEERKY